MDDKELYEYLKSKNVSLHNPKVAKQAYLKLIDCLNRMGYSRDLNDLTDIKKFLVKSDDSTLKTKAIEFYNVVMKANHNWRGGWEDRIVSSSTLISAKRGNHV